MKKNIFLFLAALFFFLINPFLVHAFEISPIKILSTGDPGSNQTLVLKVKNSDTVSKTFLLSVFGVRQNEEGLPIFERGASLAEEWVFPENSQITIAAGETKAVNFIAKIPSEALPGSYYLGLSAEPVIEKKEGSLNTRLTSLFVLQVSGLVQENISIENWKKNTAATRDSWSFNLLFRNTGSVEVPLQGSVSIMSIMGREIFSQSIVLGNKLIVGAKRSIKPEVMLQHRVVFPGLYQAQVQIKYGKTGQSTSAIAYIWYFPTWSKRVGLVLLGLVFVLVILLFKKQKRA